MYRPLLQCDARDRANKEKTVGFSASNLLKSSFKADWLVYYNDALSSNCSIPEKVFCGDISQDDSKV